MSKVVTKLKEIISKTNIIAEDYKANINYQLNPQLSDISNITNNNQSHEEIPQIIIQNFDNMNIKEMEPTTQNIHKNIFEEDFSILIDELVNLYFKELNEGN